MNRFIHCLVIVVYANSLKDKARDGAACYLVYCYDEYMKISSDLTRTITSNSVIYYFIPFDLLAKAPTEEAARHILFEDINSIIDGIIQDPKPFSNPTLANNFRAIIMHLHDFTSLPNLEHYLFPKGFPINNPKE